VDAIGHEQFHRLSHQFIARVAEKPLDLLIHHRDEASIVNDDQP
jgi:hypothetical protein